MDSWHIFAWIYQGFWQPFLAAINDMAGQLAGAVMLPATAGATIYLGATAYQDLYGGGANPILDLARRAVRIGLILACLGAGFYVGTISNLLLNTLPNELAAAIVGNANAVGAAAFDKLLGQSWEGCSQALKNISLFDPATIVIGLFIGLHELIACIGIGICFT